MKNNKFFFITCILTLSLLIACGPSQAELDATSTEIAANIFATQTAEAPKPTLTPTPTFTPTITPTPTPTPRPLSDAVLTLDDLPPGFKPEPLEDFDVEAGKGKGLVANVIESGFVFSIETDVFQVLAGQTELLALRTDQAEFDGFAQEFSNLFVDAVARGFSGEDSKNLEEIPDLDDIGEMSKGVTAILGGNPPFRIEVVFFRRDKIGSMIWTIYYDGDTPIVPIGDAARKLDSRIIELLQQE